MQIPTLEDEHAELTLETGLAYTEDQPVRVVLRKRGRRYDLSDEGRAAQLARRPRGWRERAREVVELGYDLNVSRSGAVFVPAVEGGMDLSTLAGRVAAASLALYDGLLDLE
jgi:hypothetical protein